MRHFRSILKVTLSLLILATTLSGLLAQTSRPAHMISPWLGTDIDPYEMKRFGIFPEYKNEARKIEVFKSATGSHFMVVSKKDGTTEEKALSSQKIVSIEQAVEAKIPQLLKAVQQIETYLKEGKVEREVRFFMRGENRVAGRISGISTTHIMVETDLGEAQIALEKILKIEFAGIDYQSDYFYGFENPNASRYLFGPSAIPLKKGEGYYQNVWVSVNSITYGLSDHVSVSGGIEMVSTFSALTGNGGLPIGFANIKVSAPVGKNLHLGGGGIIAGAPGEDGGGVGVGYGLATFGDKEKNLTIGTGYGIGLGTGTDETQGAGVIMVGGMSRINRRLAFVTENWVVSSKNTWSQSWESNTFIGLSGGLRIMSERITFDLALATGGAISRYGREGRATSTDSFWAPVPLPFADFVYRF